MEKFQCHHPKALVLKAVIAAVFPIKWVIEISNMVMSKDIKATCEAMKRLGKYL